MRNTKTWKYEVSVKGEKFRYRTRNEIKNAWGISQSSLRNIMLEKNSQNEHYNNKWKDIKIKRIDILIPKEILRELLSTENQ